MLLLIPVTGAKTIKNRTHLDLTTEAEDHDAEISRLLALGANREQCLRTVDEGRGAYPPRYQVECASRARAHRPRGREKRLLATGLG